jgi:hypothetical protein
MRSLIVLQLAGVAGLLAGCVYTGVYELDGRPVTSPYSDSPEPHKIYFPYVLKYPDETMFFFPASDEPPHSDLNLLAIGCDRRTDGTLAVSARVRNQGSSIVPVAPFINGDLGAFRVAAVVTTADGASEEVDAVQVIPVTVNGTVDLTLRPTRAQAADVVGVDVVADPDRIVPDPLRDNNALSWRGAMYAPRADCTVTR